MTPWLKDWLFWMLVAVAAAAVLALLNVFALSFVSSLFWTDMLLEAPYRKPEVVAFYTPDLTQQIRLCGLACIGAAFAGFCLWQLALLAARPTGPGQVRWSWRRIVWSLILGIVAIAGGVAPYWLLTVQLDTADAEAARRLAAILALLSAMLYWLLSIIAAGRMMRPAVPLSRLMPGL